MKLDLLVFIGRTDIIHNGHIRLFSSAFELADNVVVLPSSGAKVSNFRSPWAGVTCEQLIEGECSITPDVRYVSDYLYDDTRWCVDVYHAVEEACLDNWVDPDSATIGLVGYNSELAFKYQRMFPEWKLLNSEAGYTDFEAKSDVIRDILFSGEDRNWGALESMVPPRMQGMMKGYADTPAYQGARDEYNMIKATELSRTVDGVAQPLLSLDSVVIHPSGRVLMVSREAGQPGAGLLSLPGGQLSNTETIYDGCVRNLLKNTGLNLNMGDAVLVSGPTGDTLMTKVGLRRSFRKARVFDHPHRSITGRQISHTHLFMLDTPRLPPVTDNATWVRLDRIGRAFDDHAHIVGTMRRYA